MIPGSANPLLLAAAGGLQIERSLRFNSSDSAYLSKSVSSSGNRKTHTLAFWMKRGTLPGSEIGLFCNLASGLTNGLIFSLSTSNTITYQDYTSGLSTNFSLLTTAVFRDPSAWYHIVVAFDTTQATASNRIKLYVNDTQVTAFSTASYPSQNYDGFWNSSGSPSHAIGRFGGNNERYFNGYLTNIHFIDGQALTPSSFTETDATTGQLIPKTYTGSYGTNGFNLLFADNSSNTASTLGKDYSGLGNNWTPNNFSTSTGGPTSVAAASGALPVYNTTDTYGTVKGTGTRTDTNSASIVLAVGMDGTNGGTTFTDESATIKGSGSAKTFTRVGAVTSTATSKFYGSSGLFNSPSFYLATNSSADFAFGSSNYTIELWFSRSANGNIVAFETLIDLRPIDTTDTPVFGTNSSGQLKSYGFPSGVGDATYGSAGLIAVNTWYHLAVTKQGTTHSIYLNGVLVSSSTSASNPTASSSLVTLGRSNPAVGTNYNFNGYISDVRVYKGVAKYTGNFNPPSSTQNATIAAGNDSLVDSPTNYGTDTSVGGEVRGNYATLNPLDRSSDVTLTNGNLDGSFTGNNDRSVRGTVGYPASGKWYCEYTIGGTGNLAVGIAASNTPLGSVPTSGNNVMYADNAKKRIDGAETNYGATYTSGDVIGVAYDCDSNQVTFYKNNSSQGALSVTTGYTYFPFVKFYNATVTLNAGARAFAYTAPSGFKALCTQNLPSPLVTKSNTVMDVVTYTGTGATRSITGLAFSPDFVWIKSRNNAGDAYGVWHILTDIVRGNSKNLFSNATNAEVSNDSNGYLSAFTSDGFTLTAGSGTSNNVNNSAGTYVAWAWDAGTSTVSNTDGSITNAMVRANTSAGFSVVTYTGTGSTASVGHGLGIAPAFYITKRRDSSSFGNWTVYHSSVGTQALELNSTGAAFSDSTRWPSAATSTVFNIGSNGNVNTSSGTYVAYVFAPVVGYSSFGSYVGNGSSDGPMVYTGLRPRWILIKETSGGESWAIFDTARNTYNTAGFFLRPDSSLQEHTSGSVDLDILSNGFKLRSTNATINAARTYIYAAFAEAPFNYSRAR